MPLLYDHPCFYIALPLEHRQLKEDAEKDIKVLKKQGLALSDAWVSTNDALLARIWQVSSASDCPERVVA